MVRIKDSHRIFKEEHVENAKILYFSNFPDEVVALKSNKIDAFPCGRMVLSQYLATDDDLAILDEEIARFPAAYLFPKTAKGKALRDQMNVFLADLEKSGERPVEQRLRTKLN